MTKTYLEKKKTFLCEKRHYQSSNNVPYAFLIGIVLQNKTKQYSMMKAFCKIVSLYTAVQ